MSGIYTKTGDAGQTDLLGGVRVSKADIRVACCGGIDEINCALGLARSLSGRPSIQTAIETIQRALFRLAAELAGADQAKGGEQGVTQADLDYLETVAHQAMEGAGGQMRFVIPGADPASAALHVARTVIRRVERDLVARNQAGYPVRPLLMRYTNRLSDAVYALARLEESGAEKGRISS